MDEKKNKKQEDLLNVGVAVASAETIQRYGSAVKQHCVAYSGRDNEIGKTLTKGLKQISKERVNPDYQYQNIHQQAGFSAEVKDVARSNAERIINGDSTRKVRTDDQGRVNDPLYDTVTVDKNGYIIKGSQSKFIGASEKDPSGDGNATRILNKLQSEKFQKYFDAKVEIEVPSDQYEKILQEADAKIGNLSRQLEEQKRIGNVEQQKKIQDRIDKLKKIKKSLRKSTVSSDEAIFARLHPELSTTIDIVKLSHRAGIQTATSSTILGGSVSIVKNVVSLCEGEEELEEAMRNVVKDTTKTAAIGYATGSVGTALKGFMQNSESKYVRALSTTNVAGNVVAFVVSAKKTFGKYFRGEIDGVECLEQLGEQGTGMIASEMFAVIGQLAIPIPIVGGMIGGMVGYALSSAAYGVLTNSLKEAKLAREERERIERVCNEHIEMIRKYRAELEKIISEYLIDNMEIFRESFSGIKNALAIGDVDWFIDSTNVITENFGGKVAFVNMDDFRNKMSSEDAFKL